MEDKRPAEGKDYGQDHLACWGPRTPSGLAKSPHGSVAGRRNRRPWEECRSAVAGTLRADSLASLSLGWGCWGLAGRQDSPGPINPSDIAFSSPFLLGMSRDVVASRAGADTTGQASLSV